VHQTQELLARYKKRSNNIRVKGRTGEVRVNRTNSMSKRGDDLRICQRLRHLEQAKIFLDPGVIAV